MSLIGDGVGPVGPPPINLPPENLAPENLASDGTKPEITLEEALEQAQPGGNPLAITLTDLERTDTSLAKLIRDKTKDHCDGATPSKIHLRYPKEGGGYLTPPPKPGEKIAWTTFDHKSGKKLLKADIQVEIEVWPKAGDKSASVGTKKITFTYPLGTSVALPHGKTKQEQACRDAYNLTAVFCKSLKKTFTDKPLFGDNAALIDTLANQKIFHVALEYDTTVPRKEYDIKHKTFKERTAEALAPTTGPVRGGKLYYVGKGFPTGKEVAKNIGIEFKGKNTSVYQRWAQQHTLASNDLGAAEVQAPKKKADAEVARLDLPPKPADQEFPEYLESLKTKANGNAVTLSHELPAYEYLDSTIEDAEAALSGTGNAYTTKKSKNPYAAFTVNANNLKELHAQIKATNDAIENTKKEVVREEKNALVKIEQEIVEINAKINLATSKLNDARAYYKELHKDLHNVLYISQEEAAQELEELEGQIKDLQNQVVYLGKAKETIKTTLPIINLEMRVKMMESQNTQALKTARELIAEDAKLLEETSSAIHHANSSYATLYKSLGPTERERFEKRLETVNKVSDKVLEERKALFEKAKESIEKSFKTVEDELEKLKGTSKVKPRPKPLAELDETEEPEKTGLELMEVLFAKANLSAEDLEKVQDFCNDNEIEIDIQLHANGTATQQIQNQLIVHLLENCEGDISNLSESQKDFLKILGKNKTEIPVFNHQLTFESLEEIFPDLNHLDLNKISIGNTGKEQILTLIEKLPLDTLSTENPELGPGVAQELQEKFDISSI